MILQGKRTIIRRPDHDLSNMRYIRRPCRPRIRSTLRALQRPKNPKNMGYRGCDKDDEVEPKLPRIEKSAQSRFQVKLLGGFDFKGAACI
jgi:hypothetical protein